MNFQIRLTKALCFLLLILGLTLAPMPVSAASRFCQLILTQSEIKGLPTQIEGLVASRVAPLKLGVPELVGANGTRVNVLEGINRELAKPLLDSSKRAALSRLDELARAWSAAAKEEVKLIHEELRKNKIVIEADAEGLPRTELVARYPELARSIIAAAREKFLTGKAKSDRIGVAEIEQQIVHSVIDAAKRETTAKIKEQADRVTDSAVEALQASLNKVSPDWTSVRSTVAPLVEAFKTEMAARFPIARAVAKGIKSAREAARLYDGEVAPVVTAQLNSAGVPELAMPEIGIRARYDMDLGTVLLEPSQGLRPNREGMILVLDHGAGTVKSNASSWKYVIPKFVESKFNAVAMNLPMAGAGMEIRGLVETAGYLDYRYRVLRSRTLPQAGEPLVPLVQLGRSMGATKGYLHSFLFGGPENVVDAYVLSSFSTPSTIQLQVRNVLQQVANGTLKGVVPESLENAKNLSGELIATLRQIKARDPKAFEEFGDNLFFLQGRADEDGGPTVVSDLEAFVSKYAPRAHVYYFENLLTKYDIPHLEKIDPEKWEGTHTLFSNLPNYTRDKLTAAIAHAHARKSEGALSRDELDVLEAMEAINERVPDADLPALQDQYFEAMAAMHGFFDYMASNPRPEFERAARVFREHRQSVAGGKTYLEDFAARMRLTPEEIQAARPGRESRAARLKRVAEYWSGERARAVAARSHH